jgi:hypothetical protein
MGMFNVFNTVSRISRTAPFLMCGFWDTACNMNGSLSEPDESAKEHVALSYKHRFLRSEEALSE